MNAHNEKLRVASLSRARKAAKLKGSGLTWEEVGKAMGISRQRAQQLAAKVK